MVDYEPLVSLCALGPPKVSTEFLLDLFEVSVLGGVIPVPSTLAGLGGVIPVP